MKPFEALKPGSAALEPAEALQPGKPTHPIAVEQLQSRLKFSCPMCPPGVCSASITVNEVVRPKHFSPKACSGFKERVTDIFGPGGNRRLVPKGTVGWLPPDGKLGSRPDNHPPEDE